jgi:hypothetical protein
MVARDGIEPPTPAFSGLNGVSNLSKFSAILKFSLPLFTTKQLSVSFNVSLRRFT